MIPSAHLAADGFVGGVTVGPGSEDQAQQEGEAAESTRPVHQRVDVDLEGRAITGDGLPIYEQDVEIILECGMLTGDGHILLGVEVIIDARVEFSNEDTVLIDIHDRAGVIDAGAAVVP